MRHKPVASGSRQVVGTKPLWELWADSVKAQDERGATLIATGGFTAYDYAQKMGWTYGRARNFLKIRKDLKHEVARDHRIAKTGPVLFYFPPGVEPPP